MSSGKPQKSKSETFTNILPESKGFPRSPERPSIEAHSCGWRVKRQSLFLGELGRDGRGMIVSLTSMSDTQQGQYQRLGRDPPRNMLPGELGTETGVVGKGLASEQGRSPV